MNALIGIVAGCLLAACGIPQAIKTVKDGHAEGLSLNFMLMLIFGIFLMGLYIFLEHGWDWILHGEYIISISVWSISIFYYLFPRRSNWIHNLDSVKSKDGWKKGEKSI